MSAFWKSWLNGWCGAVMLFGLVLLTGAFEATSGPLGALYGLLGPAVPDFDPALRFSVALLGAVTIGWGLTLYAAVDAAHKLGGPMWRRLTVAVVAWYVIDSALSVATGFALNAVPNTLFLIGWLLPLRASGALGAAHADPLPASKR
jgi:hypothetical protein